MQVNRPTTIASAASDNATLVRAGRTRLTFADGFTINDAPCYVFFYDKATAPISTDTPKHVICIPANATATNGAGNNKPLPNEGLLFELGLGYRITKDFAHTGTTVVDANEVRLNYAID